MQVPRNLAVEHLEVTTIVVVVRDIYLYYYYYDYSSHFGVSYGILPARSTGCCVIMPSRADRERKAAGPWSERPPTAHGDAVAIQR